MLGLIQLRRGEIKKRNSRFNRSPSAEAPSTVTGMLKARASMPHTPDTPSVPAATDSTPSMIAFDLSSFQEPIKGGCTTDTQFSKALIEGVSSGVYVLQDGLCVYRAR